VCGYFFLAKTLCFVVVVSVDHAEPSSALASRQKTISSVENSAAYAKNGMLRWEDMILV